MTAYAIARLTDVRLGAGIAAYLEAFDATIAPFEGRYLVHGGAPRVVEGAFDGDVVVLAFPDRARLDAWYASEAYRAILPLRTENATSHVVFVDGVDPDHRAGDVLAGWEG